MPEPQRLQTTLHMLEKEYQEQLFSFIAYMSYVEHSVILRYLSVAMEVAAEKLVKLQPWNYDSTSMLGQYSKSLFISYSIERYQYPAVFFIWLLLNVLTIKIHYKTL